MMGDALGEAYVQQTFTPEARRRALAMVDNLIAALHDRLHTLERMSDTTRLRALAKLRALGKKIGYPDKWRESGQLGPHPGRQCRQGGPAPRHHASPVP